MSTTITGVVTNGVVVPSSPLPEGANVEVVVPENPGPRGVPAAEIRGIAAGDWSPPDDGTVKRWIQEGRLGD